MLEPLQKRANFKEKKNEKIAVFVSIGYWAIAHGVRVFSKFGLSKRGREFL